jgi:succinate-semialdehyde dehydrogenase/glutarate-semialdehyde dehydrogenase
MDRPEGKRAEVRYEPVGPVAAFAPWNFPSLNIARKVGGAIAAGCSVIVKPSEETPAAALATVQCLLDAGLPGDVCQVVFGVPDDVSRHLLGSSIIRKLSFTGSTVVGKHLSKLAAEDLKRTTMELGGHGPVLVFDDANIDKTLDVMAGNAFRNAGQVCVSPTRFLVEEPIFDQFREGFIERVKALKVGNGMEGGVQVGPMANGRGPDQIDRMVKDAVAHGATLHTGGERIGNQGYFYAPTVLSDVPTDAEIMNEEPFGPVAILNSYAGETEMIAEANRLPYGLAAYAWSEDTARQERVISQIESGMIAVNAGGVSAMDMPFGGVKWSGHGHEDGREGIMACMVTKSVHMG